MAKSKYNDNFPLLAEGWARDGFTDNQIAVKLGITKQTFYNYQKKYVDFFDSIKRGKAPVDTEVENALLKRAKGYSYNETKTITNPDGTIQKTVTEKEVIPDTTAQIFWLKNRKPDKWRDKQEVDVTERNPIDDLFNKLDNM